MLPAHQEILSIILVTNNKCACKVRQCAAGLKKVPQKLRSDLFCFVITKETCLNASATVATRLRLYGNHTDLILLLSSGKPLSHCVFLTCQLCFSGFSRAIAGKIVHFFCRTYGKCGYGTATIDETDAEIPIVREDVQQVGQESVGQDVSTSSETNTQCDSCLPELSSSIKPGFHIILNVSQRSPQ